MFIGAGIGLLFEGPDVGGAVGMGLGFLAMAYIREKYGEIRSEKSVTLGKWGGSILLALTGLAFILGGLGLLLGIRMPFRYMGGLISVAIGLLFLAAAFKLFKLS